MTLLGFKTMAAVVVVIIVKLWLIKTNHYQEIESIGCCYFLFSVIVEISWQSICICELISFYSSLYFKC